MLFKGKERMEATLMDVKPKVKRAKQGKDGEKLKFVDLHFTAKLTSGLRGKLSARLQPIIAPREKDDNGTTSAINKVDLAVPSMEGVVRLFTYQNFKKESEPQITLGAYQNFKKESKPQITLGAAKQPKAHVSFASIFFKEGDSFLDIHIASQWTPEIWKWAGEHFGEAERDITLEIEPEKDLFEEEEVDKSTGEVKEPPKK